MTRCRKKVSGREESFDGVGFGQGFLACFEPALRWEVLRGWGVECLGNGGWQWEIEEKVVVVVGCGGNGRAKVGQEEEEEREKEKHSLKEEGERGEEERMVTTC